MASDIERTIGQLESSMVAVSKASDNLLSNMQEMNREVIETGMKVKSAHKRIDETQKKIGEMQPAIDKHEALHNQAKGAARVTGLKYGFTGGGIFGAVVYLFKLLVS